MNNHQHNLRIDPRYAGILAGARPVLEAGEPFRHNWGRNGGVKDP